MLKWVPDILSAIPFAHKNYSIENVFIFCVDNLPFARNYYKVVLYIIKNIYMQNYYFNLVHPFYMRITVVEK